VWRRAEAKHLAALGKHPQIPELFAYFDIEGQPYLVQQFIDGEDLQQELATAGTFNQAKIRELLLSLLPVLDFLHHQSPPVIHRDIKPANIIRRRSDGKLILVDFGAAKQATQTMLAKTGTVIGSPEYVAPEQARGKPAFASDLYSLGVTCIYLLTQVSPFELFDVSQDAWVWRDYLVDNPVDEWLGKVLDKMIANALGQRYQSAPAVRAALENRYPRTATLDRRDYLAIDIAGGSLNNCQFVPPSVKPAHSIDNLAIQPFGFETAKLVMAKAFWGGTKSVVQKSQGIANRFFQDLGRGVRLEMIGIPAGTLLMGAPELEAGSSDSQRPQHRVRVAT